MGAERIRPIDLLDQLQAQGVRTRAELLQHIARRRAELAAAEEEEAAEPAAAPRAPRKPAAATDDDQEDDMVRRAQAGDNRAMTAVLERLEPLILHAIRKAHLPLPAEDLAQEARIAVVQALPRYETGRAKLETFLAPRIFGAIRDYARSAGYLLHGGARSGRVERFERLDAPVYDEGGRPVRLYDVIPDGRETAERLRQIEDREEFGALVRSCRQQVRQLLYLYFFRGLTMREAGEIVGVCESRVSQLINNEMPRLRQVAERRFGLGS